MTSSKCVTVILLFAAMPVLAGLLGSAAADSSASPVPAVNTTDGLALKGYDPVAYFTDTRQCAISVKVAAYERNYQRI